MEHFTRSTFAIVDVETTGTSPTHDRIIEIGILRVENGVIVATYQTLLNPEKHVPPSIERITGIHAEELLSAPTFNDIRERIRELLDGAIFVAHNARFDYGFIKNEFKREGLPFNAKCLCTVRLSRKMFPEHAKHDLSTIIERYGFSCESRHRAFDDAKVLWDFMLYIQKSGRGEEMESAMKELLRENTLPQFLDAKTVKALPEGPGIYIFYGPEDEVLYVGKSKNIRYRVLSHFANDHATTKEMHLCQETCRVEAEETPGELSALLLESELVKELSPLYNRQLRRRSELVLARRVKNGKYYGIELVRTAHITPDIYKGIVGIFRSVNQAKQVIGDLALEHSLCPKLLGLEKGAGACFYSQLGKCKGACTGKEDPEEYEARFKAAFKARKLKAWPFARAILIEEKDKESSRSFVLDNWCLVASVQADTYDTELKHHKPVFDYDAYKIFVRYLRDPKHKRSIKNLTKRELARLHAVEEDVILSI